jgi:hypothetical protein
MTKDEALKMALEALKTIDEAMPFPVAKLAQAAIKEALAQPEDRNFCPRCGKRTADLTTIHTCTPPQEALYGMNQDDWKDVVAAISKVRDGRGIYLACRPADVFKDWFLALGTAKVKEKT